MELTELGLGLDLLLNQVLLTWLNILLLFGLGLGFVMRKRAVIGRAYIELLIKGAELLYIFGDLGQLNLLV